MGITSAVVGGASILGGLFGAQGAQDAAATQVQAGREAIASQERTVAAQQELSKPYVSAGNVALQKLLEGTQPGGQFTKQFEMKDLPTITPFKAEESQAQNFATKAALAAMQNQMAVGGQGLSSNAIAGAGKLAADIGSQYEQQGFNQWLAANQNQFSQALAGQQQAQNVFQMNQQNALAPLEYLAGIGQAGAAGSTANIGATGANIANLQTGIGNAQAAGQVGTANAIGGAFGNIGQMYLLQSILGK